MKKILKVENLNLAFTLNKETNYLIKNISFDLYENEVLGIVGESGSGKSILTQSIVKLFPSTSVKYKGKIFFENKDLFKKTQKELTSIRKNKIAYIFQDPSSHLNPTMKIGKQIIEVITEKNPKEKALTLLNLVGIKNAKYKFSQFPHELSGGEKQRAMIAIAIAQSSKIIIADEPTTSLDVTVQTQIIDLLKQIQKNTKLSIIFISHDLKIVSTIAKRILVLYAGKIVEEGSLKNIITTPKHPYSKLLLESIPKINSKTKRLKTIKGKAEDTFKNEKMCVFAKRCPKAKKICFEKEPPFFLLGKNNKVACWLYEK